MSAAVPLASIFERLRPEAMREATDWDGAAVLPAGADAAVSVRGEGGSSSGHATTYLADNTEWSATGRMGVSISRYLPYISFTSPLSPFYLALACDLSERRLIDAPTP